MAIKISATKGEENHLIKDSSGLLLGVVFVLLSVFFVSQRKSLWELSNTKTNI